MPGESLPLIGCAERTVAVGVGRDAAARASGGAGGRRGPGVGGIGERLGLERLGPAGRVGPRRHEERHVA